MADYDLLVIGCGPGGQRAAIAAAKLGRRAAVVERRDVVGGVCVNTGTIPSKSLREAVMYLTGLSQRDLYGQSYRVKQDITMEDLSRRSHHVVEREIEVVRDQLARNRVALLHGNACFVDSHTVAIRANSGEQRVSADRIIIATGTRPARPPSVAFDEHYRTNVEHVYAVGDVIGFPALASTSMEQGRLAALHSLGEATPSIAATMPIGIYSIPEISYVGETEAQLTDASVPYEVGISRYRELARGQICGDSYGMLKLLVSPVDRRILGVHLFGTGATEIVHIGQAVMGCGGTVDYLLDGVFNYPTLAEAYKVAALDVTNKLRTVERLRH